MLSWLNNIYLFGLVLATIPILIHFLTRRKLKLIKFSTLRFIDEIQRTRMRSFKLKQILLLIIRTLIITFFVLAFARPTIRGVFRPSAGAHERTSVVILLDNSFSTSQELGGIDLFTLEKTGARKLISLLKEGDEVSFALFNAEVHPLTNHFTRAFQRLDRIIDTLSISYCGTNIAKALAFAKDELKYAKNANKEIYILTDNRFSGWKGFRSEDFKLKEARVFLLIYKGSEDNLCVSKVSFPAQLIEVGKPFEISYEVANYSGRDYSAIVSNLFIDDERVAQSELVPRKLGYVSGGLVGNISKGGYHYGCVTIDNDALAVDDVYYFSFKVPEKYRVLVLGGSERIYLKFALAPVDSEGFFTISDYDYSKGINARFDEYDVIVISSPPAMAPEFMSRLRTAIESGKGLIVFTGEKTDLKSWGNFFSPQVSLFGVIGAQAGYVGWGRVSYNHPIFQPFDPHLPLPTVNFYRIVQASAQTGIIAEYGNNLPAIIETKIGQGKVIVVTSSVEPSWSTLYISGAFIPFIQRAVQYVAKDVAKFDEPFTVGTSALRVLEEANITSRLILQDPRGNRSYLQPKAWTGKIGVLTPQLNFPGIYRIFSDKGELVDLFAVNLPSEESDLKPLDEKAKNDFIIINPQNEELTGAVFSSRYGKELWKPFLLLVFFLMVIELVLGSNWRKAKE